VLIEKSLVVTENCIFATHRILKNQSMPTVKPTTALNVKKANYAGVINLANGVFAAMTAAVANFPTPTPPLTQLQTDTTTAETASTAWGVVGNRGSHSDLLNLRAAINVLYNDLLALASYVQNTAEISAPLNYVLMASIISSSGFSVKNSPSPQGALSQPQNVHRVFTLVFSLYTPKIKWDKPLGLLSPGNVKMYGIYRNTVNDFPSATRVGTSTRTQFIDNPPAGFTYFYFIVGFNAAGAGAESMAFETSTPV